ncbi:hypothetical protein MLD52_10955 [Puniceicoccaceae bacterium K14]|nr:hypothetical protein [Puniceicoccaceae bacterium K14]
MAASNNKIEWCTVKLGEDYNWWVMEVSDDIHWDVDGLSVVDPRQIAHIADLVEPLQEYHFDQDIFEQAFIPFRIDKDLGDGYIRLVRSKESILDSDEPLFGLPDIVDEENGPFADFITHITKMRVSMLNDIIEFEQKLTIDEVEEHIREEENNNFIEGKSTHMFEEITTILDYVPAGFELDEDGDGDSEEIEEGLEDIPDFTEDEEEAKKISQEESLKWEDDDEDESDKDDTYEGPPPGDDEEEKPL